MNELLVARHLNDGVVQVVLLNKLIVIIERNAKPIGHSDAGQMCMKHFAKISRFASISDYVFLALFTERCKTLHRKIRSRCHQIPARELAL